MIIYPKDNTSIVDKYYSDKVGKKSLWYDYSLRSDIKINSNWSGLQIL